MVLATPFSKGWPCYKVQSNVFQWFSLVYQATISHLELQLISPKRQEQRCNVGRDLGSLRPGRKILWSTNIYAGVLLASGALPALAHLQLKPGEMRWSPISVTDIMGAQHMPCTRNGQGMLCPWTGVAQPWGQVILCFRQWTGEEKTGLPISAVVYCFFKIQALMFTWEKPEWFQFCSRTLPDSLRTPAALIPSEPATRDRLKITCYFSSLSISTPGLSSEL